MNSCFRKSFIEHPESVGENYLTHGLKASKYGITLIGFGIAELIHAVIPGIDLFELFGTSSNIELSKLTEELENRKINGSNKAD